MKQPKRKVWVIPVIIVVGLAVLGIGGYLVGTNLESQPSFCASCHTQPESTFYARFQGAIPVDLASYHGSLGKVCINCHAGPGFFGHVVSLTDGAINAVKMYIGTAIQPAIFYGKFPATNCLQCHQDVPQTQDFQRHWHAFLSQWQAVDPNAAVCATCHSGHTTAGDASTKFVDQKVLQNTCQACHDVLGGGE